AISRPTGYAPLGTRTPDVVPDQSRFGWVLELGRPTQSHCYPPYSGAVPRTENHPGEDRARRLSPCRMAHPRLASPRSPGRMPSRRGAVRPDASELQIGPVQDGRDWVHDGGRATAFLLHERANVLVETGGRVELVSLDDRHAGGVKPDDPVVGYPSLGIFAELVGCILGLRTGGDYLNDEQDVLGA